MGSAGVGSAGVGSAGVGSAGVGSAALGTARGLREQTHVNPKHNEEMVQWKTDDGMHKAKGFWDNTEQ